MTPAAHLTSMTAKTVIHLVYRDPIRVAESYGDVLARTVSTQGFLSLTRITDHGAEKKVALAIPSILSVEEA